MGPMIALEQSLTKDYIVTTMVLAHISVRMSLWHSNNLGNPQRKGDLRQDNEQESYNSNKGLCDAAWNIGLLQGECLLNLVYLAA